MVRLSHFFLDYFDDENSLIERLPTVSNQNRFPDNLNQLESAVEEPLPFGLRSPNTIMNINNLQGGRRKKTRRKKSKKNKRSIWKIFNIISYNNYIIL